jgi:hypoxanthine phosphoribosyltransferase
VLAILTYIKYVPVAALRPPCARAARYDFFASFAHLKTNRKNTMLTEDGKHLYVSYGEYHNLIEKLAIKIHQSGFEFDTILCLARGGMRPGDILSRIFEKPLAIMSTSSYRANAGTEQGHLDIAKYITTPQGEIAGKVLLVDDLADSGHTLQAVVKSLRDRYAPITDLRTAVIWTKGVSAFQPDYSVDYLPTNPWIHQPFEVYDRMHIQDVLDKWKV